MLSEDYAASFQEYFDAYYEEILKYCYIHLGYNQTHAQECCQEVFLLCLQKQPAFPTPDGLKVWLYRTAKFQVKNMLRNLQTEQVRLDYYQERPEGAEAGAFAYQPDLDAALELNFGIHVDGHVMVDFNSFPQVIDALGGVDITLTQAESDYLGLSGAGDYHMDGELAMRYSRIRYIDSDFGRTNRQRTVLNSLFMRFKDLGWGEILGAANQVLDLVYTDMDAGTILAYGSEMLGVQEIEQHHVPDDGEYYDAVINGMMVLVPYLDDIHTRLGEVLYGIG